MNIIAVDDEQFSLIDIMDVLSKAIHDCNLKGFRKPGEALEYAKETRIDIAFLDIELGVMCGIELAKLLKDIYFKTNVIFVTGYAEYALDAFSVKACDYVLKPATAESIKNALLNLRHPLLPSSERVRVQTFGSFEIFVDGKPLQITRSKAKELLAFLVDKRGASATKEQIASVLWEDKSYTRSLQKQTQNVIAQMMKVLSDNGISDIIIKSWNNIAVDVSKLDCDYYHFLRGNMAVINTYAGEYMNEYSWAEMTAGMLTYRK